MPFVVLLLDGAIHGASRCGCGYAALCSFDLYVHASTAIQAPLHEYRKFLCKARKTQTYLAARRRCNLKKVLILLNVGAITAPENLSL
jgi:hypothetical protein